MSYRLPRIEPKARHPNPVYIVKSGWPDEGGPSKTDRPQPADGGDAFTRPAAERKRGGAGLAPPLLSV